jgi:hypothetical protein
MLMVIYCIGFVRLTVSRTNPRQYITDTHIAYVCADLEIKKCLRNAA